MSPVSPVSVVSDRPLQPRLHSRTHFAIHDLIDMTDHQTRECNERSLTKLIGLIGLIRLAPINGTSPRRTVLTGSGTGYAHFD